MMVEHLFIVVGITPTGCGHPAHTPKEDAGPGLGIAVSRTVVPSLK
jgi:hypothetical protein